jgi:RHS repeat-associated protein
LGTINLANGALNIKLPLGEVGGRGFSVPISLNHSSKVWSLSGDTDQASDTHQLSVVGAVYGQAQFDMDFFCRLAPGWSYGAVPFLRAQGVHIRPYPGGAGCDFHYALVKLTLVMPDRGEIELRDDAFDGEPRPAQTTGSCLARDANRGTRWHATDGSGTIFVSDPASSGVSYGDLSGTIITADGMRYHFTNWDYPGSIQDTRQIHYLARCDLMTERNGNFVQVSYPSNLKTIQFTDQLGRITTLQKNATDPDNQSAPKLPLLVTLPGYGGQPRYYKVLTDTMNLHYRSDQNPGSGMDVIVGDHSPGFNNYTWPRPHISLFPSSEGLLNVEIDNQIVVTQLVLPDGRTLNFNYNQFGEVAEVTLPTGAKMQYDYGFATLPAGNTLEQETRAQMNSVTLIDRAVLARRTYQPGSATPEASWNYSYGSLTPNNSTTPAPAAEVTCTSGGQLLLHERHFFLPSGNYFDGISTGIKGVDGTHYTLWSTGLEFRSETFDSNGTTVLGASETDWSQRTGVVWSGGYTSYINEPQEQPENDNRTTESRRYLDDGSMARAHSSYDDIGVSPRANNPKTVDEYDFDGSVKRHTETSYVGSYTGDGTHLLRLPSQTSTYDVANGTLFAQTTYEYDNYTTEGGTNPNHQALQSYTSVASHTASYDLNYLTRGNPTAVTQFVRPGSITSYPRYDILGNVVSSKDPRGNVATISFADDFGDGSNPGSGAANPATPTYALPTLITSPPPNPGESAHTARTQFDFSTGLLTGFKDRNGTITQTIYNDPFDRPTLIKVGLGATSGTPPVSIESHTAMYYAGAPVQPPAAYGVTLTNNDVLTAKDQVSLDDGSLRSWTHTDGFGRTVESWTRDPQGNVHAVSTYDGMGRVITTSNPFRMGETEYDTTTAYDLAGRVKTVTTADLAVVSTAYSGNQVTVTDQASKTRSSTSDGLGRLIQVTEDPGGAGHLNYQTTYGYDVLDNLTGVTQVQASPAVTQTRTFVYDGLKRLTDATNPESGHVQYAYDENGNLNTNTDARSITTTYIYDTLNRVKTKSYQGDTSGTPAVAYLYDSQTVPTLPTGAPAFSRGSSTGRLVAMIYGSGNTGTYQGYDQTGRVVQSIQVTETQATGSPNPQAYGFSYGYDLASEMLTETYPSGRIVQTEYDTAGRVAGVRSQGATSYYAGGTSSDTTNRIQYAPHGAVSAMKLGNGRWEHTTFNSRLQPAEIGLGSSNGISDLLKLEYTYSNSNPAIHDNSGNVLTQKITSPTNSSGTLILTQTYSYDALNRLLSGSENGSPGWGQTYDYDRYGNRAVRNTSYIPPANTVLTPQSANSTDFSAFAQTTNRLNQTTYPNVLYDAAGNLTRDQVGRAFSYDAENRQITFNGTSGQYFYDGDARRVKKIDSTGTTVFVYNMAGQLIAEYTSGTPSGGGTSYLTSDHLGSTRVVTKADGSVKARYDYLPFGEEIPSTVGGRSSVAGYGGADSTRQKFTQKERDNESGLDYFLARYYSSAQGRFTSPDEFNGGPVEFFAAAASANPTFYADIVDPQTLNKYQYCLNNPLKYVDPNGHQEKKSLTEQLKNSMRAVAEYFGVSSKPIKTEEDANPNNPENKNYGPGGVLPSSSDVAGKTFETYAKAVDKYTDVLEFLDPVGGASFVRAFMKGDTAGATLAGAGIVFGSKASVEAVNILRGAGTHEVLEVSGRIAGETQRLIPTRQEAEKLIGAAGGRIERIEKAHKGAGHAYAHINYTTASGEKATVQIKSVGKEFHRMPKKKIRD